VGSTATASASTPPSISYSEYSRITPKLSVIAYSER